MEIDDVFGLVLLIGSIFIVSYTVRYYPKIRDSRSPQRKIQKIK